jgi:hypothetical protein
MTRFRASRAMWVAVALALQPQAWAQVPQHPPGTVCATPYFWCWAAYPGPPGGSCACATPSGWVLGRLI